MTDKRPQTIHLLASGFQQYRHCVVISATEPPYLSSVATRLP